MTTECPHCGQHYDIDDEDQNCQFQCVNCQTIFCPCSFVETINSSIDLSQFFVHYRTGGDCHKIDDSFDVADDLPQGYEFYRENKWTGKNILVTGFKYELYIAIRSLVRKIKATPVTRVTKTGCDVVVYGSEERFTTSFETAAKYGIPMITI